MWDGGYLVRGLPFFIYVGRQFRKKDENMGANVGKLVQLCG